MLPEGLCLVGLAPTIVRDSSLKDLYTIEVSRSPSRFFGKVGSSARLTLILTRPNNVAMYRKEPCSVTGMVRSFSALLIPRQRYVRALAEAEHYVLFFGKALDQIFSETTTYFGVGNLSRSGKIDTISEFQRYWVAIGIFKDTGWQAITIPSMLGSNRKPKDTG